MAIPTGTPAPDFTLDGVPGDAVSAAASPSGVGASGRYTLSSFRGAPVVLVFYPKDNSPICTAQLRSYTDDIGSFADVGAQVLAISPQSVDEHAQFVAANGPFAFPLLSDLDRSVGEAFGILGPIGFYRRSVFVIDGEGIVRWARRAAAGLTFRPPEEIVEAVRSIVD